MTRPPFAARHRTRLTAPVARVGPVLVALLSLVPSTGSYGQTTVGLLGDEVIVRSFSTLTQEVGAAADGRSFHTWMESADVFWRGFDASGSPLGPHQRLNTMDLGTQYNPDLAVQPDGSFFAIWVDQEGEDAIRGRFFDPTSGTLEAQDDLVNEAQWTPAADAVTAVAALTDGRYLAIWDSFESPGGDDGNGTKSIQARLVSAAGAPLGSQLQVNSVEAGWQYGADVTHMSDGGFFAVWRSATAAGSDPDNAINGRRFDSAGNPVGPDAQINTTEPGAQHRPRIATNSQGDMLVVWWSPEVGAEAMVFNQVRARWLHPDGTPNGDDFLVSTRDDVHNLDADVTGTARGFVVTWYREFDPASGGSHDVDARVVTGPDEFSITPFKVDTTSSDVPGGNQFDPAVAAYSDRVLLTWRGVNNLGGHHQGVYARGLQLCIFCDDFESGDTSEWSSQHGRAPRADEASR